MMKFSPYDTIVITPTLGAYIVQNSGVINIFLQLLNLGAILEQ